MNPVTPSTPDPAMNRFTDNQHLNRHRHNVKSQFGEDGIIAKIFEILPRERQNHWSCEFGAWDGKHCSNTYNLLMNAGWQGVLIEANPRKFRDLRETYRGVDRAVLLNEFVQFSGANTLDDILARTAIPKDFDLLSIDIDGNDYHILASLRIYRPKVIVIEFNPTIPDNIAYIQEPDPRRQHGSSLRAITELARQKDYELICVNAENAFFVDRQYFPRFDIQDNSITALKYYREPLQVFQLYDGTLVFQGAPSHRMIWYNLPTDFNRLQILPRFVRHAGVPWGNNLLLRVVIKLLRKYRLRFWQGVDADPGAWKL